MARTNRFKPSSKEENKKKASFSKNKKREKIQLKESVKEYY